VTLDQFHASEPSGWGLAAPQVQAFANAFDLNHWMIVAPLGVVLNRPSAGATAIAGQVLRASWVGQGAAAPRVVIEGLQLSFTAQPGAKPFPLASVDRAVFYTRPLPDDQVEARLYLSDARATPASRLDDVAGHAPIGLVWQAAISKLSAFHGKDAPSAARAWSTAGGTVTTSLGGVAAQGRTLGVRSSQLNTDADGRLRGMISLELKGGGDAVRALGADHAIDPAAATLAADIVDVRAGASGKAQVDLDFQAGAMTLGPVAIAPSPKVF